MKQTRKSLTAESLALPEGARQSLASFGIDDEEAQNDFFLEIADGLQEVAHTERKFGLRAEDLERP